MQRLCFLLVVWALSAAGQVQADERPIPAEIRFNRDIRPILSDTCFACHGPDEKHREAKLRLDIRDGGALGKRRHGAVIVPGKPDESQLIQRILSKDPDEVMPPPELHKTISPRAIALLKRWIEQGAIWEGHWVYEPLAAVVPPAGAKHPVDAFVDRGLKAADLKALGQADRRTLIRRLSFDLTGLPPTPEQVDAFLADKRPDAYERLVDQLLASPRYGERMAMYWLDLVRYADTIGYHSDNPRNVYLYRAWVVDAFNTNMPYDRFTVEQLAGDQLPEPTVQQKIASGYNRLLQTTEEGGAQAKEYAAIYAADRVRNVSGVWMGATVGCAQCHDHKYDPYTARDFYTMAAFFADVKENAVGKREAGMAVPTVEQTQALAKLREQLNAVDELLKTPTPESLAAQAKWESERRAAAQQGGSVDTAWIADKKIPDAQKQGDWKYIDAKKGPVRGAFSRRQSGSGIVQHFVIGAKDLIQLTATDTFYAWVYLDPKNPPKQVMLQFNDGSWEHRAYWGQDKISFGGVGQDTPGHRPAGDLPAVGGWVRLSVRPDQVGLKAGDKVNGIAFTQFDGLAYWDEAGVNRSGTGLGPDLEAIVLKAADERSAQETAALSEYFRMNGGYVDPRAQEREQIQKQIEDIDKNMPRTLVSETAAPRMTRILPRGNWLDDSGEVVQPAIPSFLGKLEVGDRRATRLDLAQWLVQPDNPLTARTFVNRLWKLMFGAGLSRIVDDLGSQGQPPTHPELLDWMAHQFVQRDWDVKAMVRLIVTSETYKRDSSRPASMRLKDPLNQWYAGQTPLRLNAEMVRDNALAVSGLLVEKLGGTSAMPYQPDGYWQHLNFPRRTYQADKDADQYRRGLYTHWQRSFLHPSLMAFDAPSREECTAERPRSNTPLQALVLLNDPTYVESARVLAERVWRAAEDDQARMDVMCRRVLSRTPTDRERPLLMKLLADQTTRFAADPAAAKALLSVGLHPAPADADVTAVAAWTSVARAVLNLHETITRN